jgi:hypothetical protein
MKVRAVANKEEIEKKKIERLEKEEEERKKRLDD